MLIAAEQTGRRCRGVELDPLYVDVILSRYQGLTGRVAVLEGTDETIWPYVAIGSLKIARETALGSAMAARVIRHRIWFKSRRHR